MWTTALLAAAFATEPISVEGRDLEPFAMTRLLLRNEQGRLFGVAVELHRVRIIEDIRAAGFPIVGAESVLFDQDRSDEAELQLGGTVIEAECDASSRVARCELGVRWELFDLRADAVVYEAVTRAQTDRARGEGGEDVGERLLHDNVLRLLSREKFAEALEPPPAPAGAAVATWSGALEVAACAEEPAEMPAGADHLLDRVVLLSRADAIGTATLISPDGFALTAAHLVGEDETLDARARSGLVLPASVVRVDEVADVALVQLPGAGHPCLGLDASLPTLGSDLYAAGSALVEELSFSLTRGVMSAARDVEGTTWIQTDVSLSPGFSGGPLVDVSGGVRGIVSFKIVHDSAEGLGFAVPVAGALEALELELGALSGELGEGAAGRRTRQVAPQERERVVDREDPSLVHVAPREPEDMDRKYVTSAIGVATGLTGASVVAASWVWRIATPRATTSTWHTMQAVNTLGWVGVGAGGVLAVAPYVGDGPGVAVGVRW